MTNTKTPTLTAIDGDLKALEEEVVAAVIAPGTAALEALGERMEKAKARRSQLCLVEPGKGDTPA